MSIRPVNIYGRYFLGQVSQRGRVIPGGIVGGSPIHPFRNVLSLFFTGQQLTRIEEQVESTGNRKNEAKVEKRLRRVLLEEGVPRECTQLMVDVLLVERRSFEHPGKTQGYVRFTASSSENATSPIDRPACEPHFRNNAELILEAARQAPSGKRAVVLGAGVLLDVPLKELIGLGKFTGIDLVDISQAAMDAGLTRLGLKGHPLVRTHQLDISLLPPCFYEIVRFIFQSEKDPFLALLRLALFLNIAQVPGRLPFNNNGLVVSTMLWGQMMIYLKQFFNESFKERYGSELEYSNNAPWTNPIGNFLVRVQRRHIEELYQLTEGGSVAYISTDIASFDPADFQRFPTRVRLSSGATEQLTPELLLDRFKVMMLDFDQHPTGVGLSFEEWVLHYTTKGSPVGLPKIVNPESVTTGLTLRPLFLPKNPAGPIYFNPELVEKIGGDAWLWELLPECWSLVQGIVLRRR